MTLSFLHHLTRIWDIEGMNGTQIIPISEESLTELKEKTKSSDINKCRHPIKVPYDLYVFIDGYNIFFIKNK